MRRSLFAVIALALFGIVAAYQGREADEKPAWKEVRPGVFRSPGDPAGYALVVDGKALLVDVKPEERMVLSVRNIDGVRVLASNRVSARDVMDTRRVVLTKAALEKLQEALG